MAYLRKGQFIFNFLEWLKRVKQLDSDKHNRMADPYYLDDKMFDKYLSEFYSLCKKKGFDLPLLYKKIRKTDLK